MKNKNIIILLCGIGFIIVLLMSFLFGWFSAKKTNSKKQALINNQQLTLESPKIKKEPEIKEDELLEKGCDCSETKEKKERKFTRRTREKYFKGNVYSNKEFNFDIVFPETWKSFTTQIYVEPVENLISEDDDGVAAPPYKRASFANKLVYMRDNEIERVDLALPLEDRNSSFGVYNTVIMSIYVSPLSVWEGIDCKDNFSFYCFRRPKEIARNEEYVVEVRGPSYAKLEVCSPEIKQDNDFLEKNKDFCKKISSLRDMISLGEIEVVFR